VHVLDDDVARWWQLVERKRLRPGLLEIVLETLGQTKPPDAEPAYY